MSEQIFGEEAVQASQGYREMPVQFPIKPDDGLDTFGPDLNEVQRAADELTSRRDAEQTAREGRPVDVHRDYLHIGGEKAGQPRPENETVSAAQAASDLAMARQGEAETRLTLEDLELQRAIDALRTGEAQQQQLAEPVALDQALSPNDVSHPKPEPVPPPDDDWQRHLQDPRILNAVQQHVEQATAQANAAAQAYNQAAINAGNSALAGLQVAFPELRGSLDPQRFPIALQTIAQSSPERAQAIIEHVGAINQTLQAGLEAQQAQQRQAFVQARKQWDGWARSQDAAYSAYAAKVSSAERQAIEEEARRMVLEESDVQSVAMSWHTSPELRSAQAQRLLFDAARWRLGERARESARRKISHPVPHVQKPGSPLERASDVDVHLQKLSGPPGSPMSVKQAAALVVARRAARR